MLRRCPACNAPFSSTFAVDCEECGAQLREPELFGVADPARRSARPRRLERLDRREADHRDGVVVGDLAVVELAEEARHLVGAADLRVVVLDLVRRELAERFTSTLSITASKTCWRGPKRAPHEHRDDHPLLVLARLVAEPDRRRLAVRAELRLDDRRVEVERERRAPAGDHTSSPGERGQRPSRPSPARRGRRAGAARRRAAASAPRRPRAGTPPGCRRAGRSRSGRGRTRRP